MKKLIVTFSLLLACYLSPGQNWQPVGNGVNSFVYVMDSANGLLYMGGNFTSAGSITVNYITAWNGSTYSALGSGVSGGTYVRVSAITEYKGNIIVGGTFTSAGGVPANNIAMWNGSSWSFLGIGVNAGVSSLAVFNNNLYVTGSFDSAGGVPALHIAQWNGTSWAAVGSGTSYVINSMAVYDSNLYGGGNEIGSNDVAELSKWNGTVWDSITGIYSNNSNPCTGETVKLLNAGNGLLYIIGPINDSAGKYHNFASWNGNALNWNMGGDGDFTSLFLYNGVTVGGYTNIVYYNDTTWKTVGNGIGFCNNSTCNSCAGQFPSPVVFAIAGYKGKLYVGGAFTTTYGNQANYLEMFPGIVGINEVKQVNTITVYPNPSTGVFTIEEQGIRDKEQVEVYNMLGEKVYSEPVIRNSQFVINLSNQPAGIYLYRIIAKDGSLVSTGKLIKE